MFLDYVGKKINYIQEGSGKDILILHGWGANIECMRGIIDLLKPHFRVTAIDFPGFGESDEVDGFCVNDYVVSVQYVIDSLGLNLYAIVAHSFGGRVAIKYASRVNVPKLVLIGCAGLKPKRGFKYYYKVYSYKIMKKFKCFSNRVSASGSSDYKSLSKAMRHTFVKVVNEDLKDYAKKIISETLLIYGEKDTQTPLYMARKLNRYIPNSGLIIIEDAGHFCFLEKANRINIILNNYLNT